MSDRICQTNSHSPDQTGWDVRDYAAELSPRQSGSNVELENKLLARFPPIYQPTSGIDIPYQDKPCHVTDSGGRILLWYLPMVFSEEFRVITFTRTTNILFTKLELDLAAH
jgi:hypothetical protein